MSEITRRDVLRRLALTITAAGTIDRVAAQEVHHLTALAQASTGTYAPKTFNAHEYRTLERLADLIIPVENGAPGALAAGAPAWIDMISSENDKLQEIYKSGFAWLDGGPAPLHYRIAHKTDTHRPCAILFNKMANRPIPVLIRAHGRRARLRLT